MYHRGLYTIDTMVVSTKLLRAYNVHRNQTFTDFHEYTIDAIYMYI